MFQTDRIKAVVLSLGIGLFAWNSGAQAPLTINGPTDRSITSSTVNFSVPSTAGYTYAVSLNGQRVPTDINHSVSQADYHELLVTRTNTTTLDVTNRLVRFIIRASDRGDTETGLPPWVPYPTIPSAAAELAGAHIDLLAPDTFPQGLEIPVVAWVRNAQGGVVRVNGPLTATGHPSITMRRGAGSDLLAANHPAGTLNYTAQLAGVPVNKGILIEASTTWTSVSGAIAGNTVWGEDSRIAVTGSITIPAGSTLTILEGSVVRLNSGVNITNLGRISIEGIASRPVVFTPVSRTQPWGGFFLTAATSQLEASAAIFVAPCAAQSGFPGHRREQPLLYIDNRARAALTNCAAIYLAGQFHHSIDRGTPYATVTVVDSLIQRCTTAGEFNGCSLSFLNSALIEVPSEDQFYCANPDCDHDGFYLNAGNHEIRDSLVGWLKDDCFDAGSGGGPSAVVVSNCWVEGAFHEALAWSGGGRVTRTWDTVLINNGQGIECGWSSGANSPVVYGTRLLSLGNAVGARYGDNYTGTTGLGLKNGTLNVTNSLLLHNLRDVFGRPWDDTWNWRVNNMDIRNNLLTVSNSFHPNNGIWSAASDAAKLAPFMTTPPSAAVGVAIATWGSQFSMAELFQGVPVRLSSFTTNFVSVNYTFQSGATPLATGTLTFAPGETVKRIFPAGFDLAGVTSVQVVLSGPTGGELTGRTSVMFQGTVPAPQVSLGVVASPLPGNRIFEGTFVRLSAPSARTVTVAYTYFGDDVEIASGTVVFSPTETSRQVYPTGINPSAYATVRLALSNPDGATLTGFTEVTYNTGLSISLGVSTNQLDRASFSSGVPVGLSLPAAVTVSVEFAVEGNGGVLTNGTLTFTAGTTLRQLLFPTVNALAHDVLRVSLANAINVRLVAPSNVFFLPMASPSSPLLVTSNSFWRYLDTGVNAGTAWRALNYEDLSWARGCAELGYMDNDECTTVSFGPSTSSKYITTYFRQRFEVAAPTAFTNLSLWLLRDDGGAVYINGTEVYRSPTLPQPPTVITYQTLATNLSIANAPSDNTVDRTNVNPNVLISGTNVVAVEIHQHRADSSDISFNFALTGQPTPQTPPQSIYTATLNGKHYIFWTDPTFRLEQTTELKTTGTIWTSVVGASPVDISFDPSQRFFRLTRP